MTKVNATSFFKIWFETVHSRKEHLLKIWKNPTHYILSHEDSILREVANKLDLQCFPYDYYHIDAILYKNEDRLLDIPNATWVRDIRVAFEHENNFHSGLYREVSHLLLINCDLKVLVTYYPQGDHEPQLDYLHKIIKGGRQSKTLSDDESFLLILAAENGFLWEGFVYKEENWKEIK